VEPIPSCGCCLSLSRRSRNIGSLTAAIVRRMGTRHLLGGGGLRAKWYTAGWGGHRAHTFVQLAAPCELSVQTGGYRTRLHSGLHPGSCLFIKDAIDHSFTAGCFLGAVCTDTGLHNTAVCTAGCTLGAVCTDRRLEITAVHRATSWELSVQLEGCRTHLYSGLHPDSCQ
jgi:hypothetical protein